MSSLGAPSLAVLPTAAAPSQELAAIVYTDLLSTSGESTELDGRVTALEHVANRPIVAHVLDDLAAVGVDLLVLAGPAEALLDLRPLLRLHEHRFGRIEYVTRRDGVRLSTTLAAAAGLVGEAACIVGPADALTSPALPIEAPRIAPEPHLVLFLAAAAPEPTRDGIRPSIGVFGPGALRRAVPVLGATASDDLLDVAREASAAGAVVETREVAGLSRYTGRGCDLLEINRIALDRLVADVPAAVGTTNTIEGRVVVDPDATVTDSVLAGPCIIGPGAAVHSAYVGPYTAIGAGARVEGSEIERSIVASGASILHVGTRIVSSVVGRDARICRDFSVPRGLRLQVSPGAEIAL